MKDNWALLYALEQAAAKGVAVAVAFNLVRPVMVKQLWGVIKPSHICCATCDTSCTYTLWLAATMARITAVC